MKITRRQFLIASALTGAGILIGGKLYTSAQRGEEPVMEREGEEGEATPEGGSDVYVVKTLDRKKGIESLLDNFDLAGYSGKTVALKANFNSADPYPASTHLDTLRHLTDTLRGAGAAGFTLAERSGMGSTDQILRRTGVYELADELGFEAVSLDDVGGEAWVKVEADWLHWRDGFHVARVFREADRVVQTCCLKTHRFGGHFTMSLKNSVGLIAKKVPGEAHDYMRELHGSGHQRRMIAEINGFYDVDLVVMDALEAFVNRGPEAGDKVRPELLLAGRDRVAIDAVGVAILRNHGSTENVMRGKIFNLDQISRAAEIGVGVASADQIRVIPANDNAIESVDEINRVLKS